MSYTPPDKNSLRMSVVIFTGMSRKPVSEHSRRGDRSSRQRKKQIVPPKPQRRGGRQGRTRYRRPLIDSDRNRRESRTRGPVCHSLALDSRHWTLDSCHSSFKNRCPVRSINTSSSVGLPRVTVWISPGNASTRRLITFNEPSYCELERLA